MHPLFYVIMNHETALKGDKNCSKWGQKWGQGTNDRLKSLKTRHFLEQGITIVLITHSPSLAEETGRILTLVDGEFVDERRGRNAH